MLPDETTGMHPGGSRDVGRLIISHYEEQLGGAVKRLNSIKDQLAD
jgi:hypothetical protein